MNSPPKSLSRLITTLVIGSAILLLAFLLAVFLVRRREPPEQVMPPELSLAVELVRMTPEDVPMLIVGRGEAVPIEVVPMTPQVAGEVIRTHEHLFVGEVIPAGETLIEIDPRDYESRLAQIRAQAAQARSGLARLRTQYTSDGKRLKTLERNCDLSHNDYKRLQGLFENEEVGALSNVERAEMTYNRARDAQELMTQNVSLYPARIIEAEQGLLAAEAALEVAELNLERTAIKAPFDARIQEKRVEAGQYVAPGVPVLTLANDATIEIIVPLDSRDVRTGLRFNEPTATETSLSWFDTVTPVSCRVFWTEATASQYWMGQLDRIVSFNQATRTITVAIRVSAEEARAGTSELPLVAGMFCRVEIPGIVMQQVYRLPRWSVTFENQVYVANEERLSYRDVDVLRMQHEQAFIQSGFNSGDLVITTRLLNPLPGSKINYVEEAIISSTDLKNSAGGESAL
ncbi:MAG: HlyD family efflux transporter periplasmic adaptor subunit [Candidatus Hydrogenedentes bacterium]|nr:HlyD family efflux transporter periplasmic adaptor subunit [Candidatus Hydrogenedentota bacterium]